LQQRKRVQRQSSASRTHRSKKETVVAWQQYTTSQSRAIADMAGPKRRLTDTSLWDTFLGNLQPVAGVHNIAYTHYVQQQLEYDQLHIQGRINRIIPVVSRWITTLGGSRARRTTRHAQNRRSTAGPSGSADATSKNSKRPRTEARQTPNRNQVNQAMSNTEYTEMPAGTDAQCPDVGFQSQTEAKPYAHSLRTLLQNENKCLVCWSPDHRMHSCPDRSAAMKADMDRKRYISSHAGSPVNTKLTLQYTVKNFLKANCHSVEAANMQKNLDSLAGPVSVSEPISLGAGLTGREKLLEEPTGDVAKPE